MVRPLQGLLDPDHRCPRVHHPTCLPASVAGCSGAWLSWTEPCSGSGFPGIPCQGSCFLVLSNRPTSPLPGEQPDRTGRPHPCPPRSLSGLFGKASMATLNTQKPMGHVPPPLPAEAPRPADSQEAVVAPHREQVLHSSVGVVVAGPQCGHNPLPLVAHGHDLSQHRLILRASHCGGSSRAWVTRGTEGQFPDPPIPDKAVKG